MNSNQIQQESPTLFGHPTGLFTLFFAEMWERFSYYGMRALLVFYMIKGFLGYTDSEAYGVYGAYTALVYATPFIGGMLADRLLGARRAVVLGGLLMAAGHLTMTVENEAVFFIALALLICGNGFFKPNISTIVGSLYPRGSEKKDTGFTIFYMGINLGAAMSPVICGYVGETWGWHYGFGLATAGMLIGVAVFVAPNRLTQACIMFGAVGTAVAMPFLQDTWLQLGVRLFLSGSLIISGLVAFMALGRGGLPKTAGASPSEERLNRPAFPALRDKTVAYYLALIASILALSVLAPPSSAEAYMIACAAGAAILLPWVTSRNAVFVCVAAAVPIIALLVMRSELAGYMLTGFGLLAFGSLIREAIRSNKIERERMYVVLVLMFFSMLFWAFFEQAGSSVNNFTDRNIDRVLEETTVTEDQIGETIVFRVPPQTDDKKLENLPLLSQEQLGMVVEKDLLARVKRAKERQDTEKEREKKEKETKQDEDWESKLLETTKEILKELKPDDEADEDKVTISVAVAPESVPEDGSSGLVYTFTRTGDTQEPLRVYFDVSGTAQFRDNGQDKDEDQADQEKTTDYEASGATTFGTKSGAVTIPAGETTVELTITPTPDTTMEEDEEVTLTIVEGAGYELGDPNEATGELENDDRFFTMTHLSILRDEAKQEDAPPEDKKVSWLITEDHVGMGVGGAEIPASEYQAANPIYILIFGLVFSGLWSFMARMGIEPSTPVKFALGLFQLGLAFAIFWYGAQVADERGMVAMVWILVGYLLQTTGELCLSPVGLSMVTKLSPTRIVSTVMGAWFLATAFSNYLAGIIAMFTSVETHGAEEQVIPPPIETVNTYGDVFGMLALVAAGSALICFALAPLLSRWMHPEVDDNGPEGDEQGTGARNGELPNPADKA